MFQEGGSVSALVTIIVGLLAWPLSSWSHFGMTLLAIKCIADVTPWEWDDHVVDKWSNTYRQFKSVLGNGGDTNDGWWRPDEDKSDDKDSGWYFNTGDDHA